MRPNDVLVRPTEKVSRKSVKNDSRALIQRRQWTRPKCLRAENTAYFFKILIPYFTCRFFLIQIWLAGLLWCDKLRTRI